MTKVSEQVESVKPPTSADANDLSEEDQELKDELEALVAVLVSSESSSKQCNETLERLHSLIKSATTSMTSVPKPLKFLQQHYSTLRDTVYFERGIYKISNVTRNIFSKVLSVLAMSVCDQESYRLDTLKFCLFGCPSYESIGSWGHEYIRHLANEITQLILTEDLNVDEMATSNQFKSSKMDLDSTNLEPVLTDEERVFLSHVEYQQMKSRTTQEEESKLENPISSSITSQISAEDVARYRILLSKAILCLVHAIIDYLMEHNGESEAVDLCQETLGTRVLVNKCSQANYQRSCCYMLSCLPYLSNEAETADILETCYRIYCRFKEAANALRCALRMESSASNVLIVELMNRPPGSLVNDSDDIADPSAAVDSKKAFAIRRQLCYILARQSRQLEFNSEEEEKMVPSSGPQLNEEVREQQSVYEEILNNEFLSQHFHYLSRELDIMDAKQPEDVYKSNLDSSQLIGGMYDSAKVNQAMSFVNGLLNCGFGSDKLMMPGESGGSGGGSTTPSTPANSQLDSETAFVYKNKDVGMMNAVASLGWIMLWDVDKGLTQIDKYLYLKDSYIKAGAILACGVVNTTVHNTCDPAIALLSDYLKSGPVKTADRLNCIAAIIGLGIAYAGSHRADVLELLYPLLSDVDSARFDLACLAALSLGLISVGNPHTRAAEEIVTCLMSRTAKEFDSPFTKFMSLGIGLTVLGNPKAVLPLLATLATVAEPARSMTAMLIECCALAGTGNVLKVQELLHILLEKFDASKVAAASGDTTSAASSDSTNTANADSKKSKTTKAATAVDLDEAAEDMEEVTATTEESNAQLPEVGTKIGASTSNRKVPASGSVLGLRQELLDGSQFFYLPHQPMAVLCIALISMGDEITQDMSFRMFGHLLRFGELPIKRAVPLALALCYASNPQLKVLDLLSKFSHDSDQELSYNSILAMGIVGAGTNNARLAAMLRQLAIFHQRGDSFNLFMVRLAQGLTHLGKGTLTLNPWHSDRHLLSPCVVAGLLALLVTLLDVRKTFLNKMEYFLFYLTPSIQPRLLVTLNAEDQQPVAVTVRVGQAVDIVGQVGQRPKTITGFQTHSTPVLLAYGERAELATEEWLPVTRNLPLEGFVLLKKNPDFVQ